MYTQDRTISVSSIRLEGGKGNWAGKPQDKDQPFT